MEQFPTARTARWFAEQRVQAVGRVERLARVTSRRLRLAGLGLAAAGVTAAVAITGCAPPGGIVTTHPSPSARPLHAALSVAKIGCDDSGGTAKLDASGSTGGAGPLTYAFTFGDGATAAAAASTTATNHLYGTNGPFTATVTVRDASGATATATATVTLLNLAASPTSVTVGQSVTFTATGICSGARIDLNSGAYAGDYVGEPSAHNFSVTNPYTTTFSAPGTLHYRAHWSEINPYSDSNLVTITVTA
ncbi:MULTISPECIES: PKD domain-containing protein [unclassified Frankia]|uniref:PKD domain-containing protein n=1 Tax=unclassified Frankia TaxID=2632575 RepID=UPI0019333556|nr:MULTISPECIES: PKD domain-containing protein [unclassified Frankia]MBL7619112.1 PKD domain-containing protein [Frankia sp. AgB1.8]